MEINNFYIDKYNFKQLEIVKNTLDWKKTESYSFQKLSEFNEKYNLNIEPKKDCYYISSENWDESYIFWFKLKWFFNKIQLKNTYIAYYSQQNWWWKPFDYKIIIKDTILINN